MRARASSSSIPNHSTPAKPAKPSGAASEVVTAGTIVTGRRSQSADKTCIAAGAAALGLAPVALTDEQRAMLQLLLEGGQSYDDIGSLLGISPEEVRSRARAALGEIAGADPDAQVPISDYLLGQADPIGRADAVRHLQSDPGGNALAERLVAQLRLLAPKAQLPEVAAARGG